MKTIALLNYDPKSAEIYAAQIESVFSNNIIVKKYSINTGPVSGTIHADLVLVQDEDVYEKSKRSIPEDTPIMFCYRTISKDGYYKILNLPEHSEVYILDETLEMAKDIISIIYEKGIRNLTLLPACPENIQDLRNKTVIILGVSSAMPHDAKEIINIGSSLLDIITIVSLGFRLKLDYLIQNKDIQSSYSEIIPANYGLADLLGKFNITEGMLNVLLNVIEDGVVSIDINGGLNSLNERARQILEIRDENLNSCNAIERLPNIPFSEVLQKRRPVKDMLIKINGYDVIVSVEPIFHSGKLFGAYAIMKEFGEAELKQHKFRTRIIGKGHKAKYNFNNIVGGSEEITSCKEKAMRMADSNSTVLITGDSGTGKELFAQAIHNNSVRRNYQFVVINCGALPENLLESELFGYEEGSFTGARKGGKPGLFELAHNGTLFLDEIGEMPISLQSRLLRVIQERQVMRVGGDRLIDIDVRLIAATNRNISEMVRKGEFREDLFYRLNVLKLKVPSLNSRKEDIPLIVESLKKAFNGSFTLADSAVEALMNHDWRGNVRELKNYVEYLVNLNIETVEASDLPFYGDDPEEALASKICVGEGKEFIQGSPLGMLRETAGKTIDSHIFVLRQLEKGLKENKRLGRRSIYKECENNSLFISEQEIRTILMNLEKCGMARILKGRGGSVITETGLEVLKEL
ncbi:MAG: putative sigma54 specific transcriptional regulator [Firmicutes bacterium]|nr:putative sigma54 specific transcriptional regulator [Bacillota bacterium]